ncbi:hypothetical protein [Aliiroseovarius sp. F20344]|uniref:hypothetical protein n=1 Tax=Aliiroseovarius sp. F20344 TaxID=2926414 RepID=UPI001FF32924|nr:hypothetical protein [Aliiroseovarius sp. F20344]MCK0141414.1 hypothetical protein [Aliiroseovarius sp. F20344]
MNYLPTLSLAGAAVTLMLSGCVSNEGANSQADVVAEVAPETKMASNSAQFHAVEDAQELISARAGDYEKLTRDAQQKGAIGGALRGALLGLIIDADPALIVGGAVIGGMIGAESGTKVASNLILEHKNYLIRRWSLEQVLASVRTDSTNTRFDLILSNKMIDATKGVPTQSVDAKTVAQLGEFKNHAVSRALALKEILPIYDEQPVAQKQLEQELKTQLAMISEFNKNLLQLEALT